MEISVYLTRVEGNGYRATSASPVPVSVEAPTRGEALQRAREAALAGLRDGEIVKIEVEAPPHPLARFAGMWKDDDLTAYLEGIETYRRECDEGDGVR